MRQYHVELSYRRLIEIAMTNDYELVYLAQENNEDARNILHQKYSRFIHYLIQSKYKKCNFITTDIEDIELECSLIFDKAINSYNQDKDVKFITYLKSCVEKKLIDIIKASLTKKGRTENNMLSLDEETNGIKQYDVLYDYKNLIENNFVDIDYIAKIITNKLSIHEKDVLNLILKGHNKEEISILLGLELKQINNTIYRLKTKIKEELY